MKAKSLVTNKNIIRKYSLTMSTRFRCKTLILSDIHLGTKNCKAEEVNYLLENISAEKIILNGDIIDGWNMLRKKAYWIDEHTRFIGLIFDKLEKEQVEVIYLRGNHDDFLRHFVPITIGKLQIVEEYLHEGVNGRYLVLHGDLFDVITTHSKWLAILGDIGYRYLLNINRIYNNYRSWRGKEYFSLSKVIKNKVKKAVNYISKFEDHLAQIALRRNVQGIICGHIHKAENKKLNNNIHYLNSGDWVESLTAIIENFNGTFEVLDYDALKKRISS